MKHLLMVIMILGSTSVFAQGMDVFQCSLKVRRAIKSIAALEIGKHIQITDHVQDSVSTATNMVFTVLSDRTAEKLIYTVRTIDIGKSDQCIISKVELKSKSSDIRGSNQETEKRHEDERK
jgi:hypothetical protein